MDSQINYRGFFLEILLSDPVGCTLWFGTQPGVAVTARSAVIYLYPESASVLPLDTPVLAESTSVLHMATLRRAGAVLQPCSETTPPLRSKTLPSPDPSLPLLPPHGSYPILLVPEALSLELPKDLAMPSVLAVGSKSNPSTSRVL